MAKIVLITGASAGLGIEFFKSADELCTADEIWVVARRLDRLESLCSTHGKTVVPVQCDLTEDDGLKKMADLLAERGADIVMLINNAGLGKLGNVSEIDPYVQKRMIALNCGGLTAMTAIALPYIHRGGVIINVSSIASFQPNPRMTTYSSTKAFVTSFSDGLRYELKKDGIGVFVVNPGPMDTEFLPVAGIAKGSSHSFDTLPRCSQSEVAYKSVKYALKGRRSYTNKFIYKFYRVVAKVLPHSWTISWGKC